MFVHFELLNKLKRPADERETNIVLAPMCFCSPRGGADTRDLKEAKALLEELAS
jgi:hypothetical protein